MVWGAVPVAAPHVGDKTNPAPHWPHKKKQNVEKNCKKLENILKEQLREHWGYAGWCTTELSRYSQWEIPWAPWMLPDVPAGRGHRPPRPPHPRGAGRASGAGAKPRGAGLGVGRSSQIRAGRPGRSTARPGAPSHAGGSGLRAAAESSSKHGAAQPRGWDSVSRESTGSSSKSQVLPELDLLTAGSSKNCIL